MPSEELLSALAKFNEEMVKAGVMLDANGWVVRSESSFEISSLIKTHRMEY